MISLLLLLAAAPLRAQPVITGQPLDQTIVRIGSATFSVTATGTPRLAYQWRYQSQSNSLTHTDIVGATNSSLTVTNPTGICPNGRWFAVVVTDSHGSVLSRFALVQIVRRNPVILEFESAAYNLGENGGFVTLNLRRTDSRLGGCAPSFPSEMTVDYVTQNGTALASSDYLAQSGSIFFPLFETTATISIPILNDGVMEGTEYFTVQLSNPSEPFDQIATLIRHRQHHRQRSGNPIQQFELFGLEADGSAVITVSRGNDEPGTVTVQYATSDGTATAGQDYAATSGTLTFVPGETEKSFSVPILNDGLVEAAETFELILSNPTGSGLGPNATATVTIVHNDTGLEFSAGETGRVAVLRVRRGDGGPGTVTVNYAMSDGTATAGQDYVATSCMVTFGPGEVEKSFTIPILDDAFPEGAEYLRLSLSDLTGPAVFGANTNAQLILLDDEQSSSPATRARPVIAAGSNHTVASVADVASPPGQTYGSVRAIRRVSF